MFIPYGISHPQQAEIKTKINNKLDENIIVDSQSPWAAPIVLVKKIQPDLPYLRRLSRAKYNNQKRCYAASKFKRDVVSLTRNRSIYDIRFGFWLSSGRNRGEG